MGGLSRLVKSSRHLVGPPVLGYAVFGAFLIAVVGAFAAATTGQVDPADWIRGVAGSRLGMALFTVMLLANMGALVTQVYLAGVSVQQVRAFARLPWPAVVGLVVYVGGLFEYETTAAQTHYKHFIPVPGGSQIIYDLASVSGAVTTYVIADHLGSGSLFLNSAGTKLIQESYSAFGYRRSADWNAPLSPTSSDYLTIASTTRRGYTSAFHEMLDNLGLINMNGRVYDPSTGRFLSPDPIGTRLGLPQASNPYAYVASSPLVYGDPTGLSEDYDTNLIDLGGGDGSDDTSGVSCGSWCINVSPHERTPPSPYSQGITGPIGTNGGNGGNVDPERKPTGAKAQSQNWQHTATCFLKGAAVGGVAAVGVGALAVGAVVLGAPVAVVTGVLGVVGVAGGAYTVANTASQISAGNYAGAAFNVGSVAGGAVIGGGGGGRALAEGINGVPSPPWSLGSDLSQGYNPSLGSVGSWLATGPNPGSATATATGIGSAISNFLSGCN